MKSTNPYLPLEKSLGYRFRHRELLVQALTHRSYRFEHQDAGEDNQRLEFLGDAVFGLVAAEYLYMRFGDWREGAMTKMRSRLTNASALADAAARLSLGAFLRLGKGELKSGGDAKPSNLSDAMEALLGAAYLDGGLRAVSVIFNRHFAVPEAAPVSTALEDNPKGQLQELAQKQWKVSPHYRTVGEEGPAHSRSYAVEAIIRNEVWGRGTGPSKRAAETAAAREALLKVQGHAAEPPPPELPPPVEPAP